MTYARLLTTAAILLPLTMIQARADCAPAVPAAGGSVTCSGTDADGFSSSANSLTVTVQSGASVTNAAGDAIRTRGTGVTVINNGRIEGAGPLPAAPTDGIDGGNGLAVTNTGTIKATSRGIDADAKNDVRITNSGTIEAVNKAIRNQNGLNGYLLNSGTILSQTNEGYETGDNATVINSGTITAQDDAVQIGQNGSITNSGTIRSLRNADPLAEQQDGIDIDSGTITNTATGVIEAEANAGIDYDGSAITSYITNHGRIAGTTGVLVDKGHDDPANENTAAQIIDNYGVIEGYDGLALDIGAGNDVLNLHGGGTLIGGADFGEDDDRLTLFDDLAGWIAGGEVLDGGEGFDLVSFQNLSLADVMRSWFNGRVFSLIVGTPDSSYRLALSNWEGYDFSDGTYSRDEILAVAPVPLPAAGLLMVAGLGGLALLRRRRT